MNFQDAKPINKKLYLILMKEYGKVILRELKKKKETLSHKMSEGNTYLDFLLNQKKEVEEVIGQIPEGISFFEQMYLENIDSTSFDDVTAKNLILFFRSRFENFLLGDNLDKDENLKIKAQGLIRILELNPDSITEFNLREKFIREKIIESIHRASDDLGFIQVATTIIERQSLVMINALHELLLNKLSNILKEEQKLKQELLIKQKNLESELKKARKIQENLLPKSFPYQMGLKFYARYFPMNSVGGDFYDVAIFPVIDESHSKKAGLLIADVSGHGIPAAFIASMAKIIWSNNIVIDSTPISILKNIHQQLLPVTNGNFLTAFLGIFEFIKNLKDGEMGVFKYASAGHHSPYIIGEKYRKPLLDIKGQIIGLLDPIILKEYSVPFYHNDRFIFFTDGLIEARNLERKEMYGEERLYDSFERGRKLKGEEFCDFIFEELNKFTNTGTYDDDVTLVVVDVN